MDHNIEEMNYDPKLKEAMAEIKAVLRKHDIAGHIQLVSPTHAEYLLELSPSWSALKWEEDNVLRFKAQKEEKQLIDSTCHLIYQIRDLCAQGFGFMQDMIASVEKKVMAEHDPFKNHTPHEEQ